MTTFYLIRHAERTGDQQLLVGRTPGVHLTADGRKQAERIASRLTGDRIARIYSSPLERTRETAEPLARQKGVQVEISAAIGEIDAGECTGHRFPELDVNNEQWRRFNHFRSGTRMPGGEAMVEVQARFVSEMLRLRDAFPGEGIALVSHADPIKIALACWLGVPLDFYDRIEIGLGSVSVVALGPWGARVLRLNEVPA